MRCSKCGAEKSGPGEILRRMRVAVHSLLPLLQDGEFSHSEVLHRVGKAPRERRRQISAHWRRKLGDTGGRWKLLTTHSMASARRSLCSSPTSKDQWTSWRTRP